MIPILDLTPQNAALQPELDQAILGVVHSGQYILGETVSRFEQAMATWLNAELPPQVISCANGSDALYLALKTLGIGAGDEVITTPFTYIATSESILRTGATPVFVDVDPLTMNMDVGQLPQALSPRTKAIMPVHLFGLPADMPAIMAFAQTHGLKVIEDCAQAIGASVVMAPGQSPTPVGMIGDIGCFSFFPSKNLGAFGDGGMCITRHQAYADTLRMMRVHGSKQRYYHEISGINSRLDALQAAILAVKLPHLTRYNQQRQAVAAGYTQNWATPLATVLSPAIVAPAGYTHVYHQYTVRLNQPNSQKRDHLLAFLSEHGVQTMVYYPVPAYRQPSHAALNLLPQAFPVCEALCNSVFSLPMFPELTPEQQTVVLTTLAAGVAKLWPDEIGSNELKPAEFKSAELKPAKQAATDPAFCSASPIATPSGGQ
jgi:dTDP-4-amino-4,6-dideoxygalactose transaminase